MIHSVNSFPLSPSKGVENSGQKKQATGGAFQEILENVAQKKTDSTGTKAMEPQSASVLQEITGPGFNLDPDTPAIQTMTDELLNMLDQYANRLGSSENSLKDLEPMLVKIKSSADALIEKAEDSGDDTLKGIAIQSAMVANNEYLKFQRGDYI